MAAVATNDSAPLAGRLAYSVPEFARAHGLSPRSVYQLWRAGRGPVRMRVGARVLISFEAAERWRRERESATAQGPAK